MTTVNKNVFMDLASLRGMLKDTIGGGSNLPLSDDSDEKDWVKKRTEKSALLLLLLKQTLLYAQEHIPYYKRIFAQAGFSAAALSRAKDLIHLPTMDRYTVLANLSELVNPCVNVTNVRCTSGTTFCRRIPVFCCREELEANLLLNQLIFPEDSDNQRRILLRLFPNTRRILSGGGLVDERRILSLNALIDIDFPKYLNGFGYDYFDVVIRTLFEDVPLPNSSKRVSLIHATPPFLMEILTDEMLSRKVNPAETAVRNIFCSGGLLTSRVRKKLKEAWNAEVTASYSFTECNACAMECPLDSETYHFTPAAYLEVLDSNEQPVKVGQEGRLAITTLYPFQEAQLFINYLQGDIAEKKPFVCPCGFVGQSVRFVGRTTQSICLADLLSPTAHRKYVGSGDVVRILDRFPGIPSLPFHRFRLERTDKPSETTVHIHVELALANSPDRWQVLEERLQKDFQNHYREWSDLIEMGRLKFKFAFHSKGELDRAYYLGT